VRTINLPDCGRAVVYSSSSSVLAVGGDGFTQLFDSVTGERLADLEDNCGEVESVSFSCNDQTLATASRNGIRLWDIKTGSLITNLRVDGDGMYLGVAFHPHIEHVLVASHEAHVCVWDVRDTSHSTSFEVKGSTDRLHWLQRSRLRYVLVGCFNGNMEMWDVESSQQVRVFSPPTSEKPSRPVFALASSYDGAVVASGSWDGTVLVYNADLGHIVHSFQYEGAVTSMAFSPTEQMFACGFWPNTVRIFHYNDGRTILLDRHQCKVPSVAFSPDGQFLASASDESALDVWEAGAADFTTVDEHRSEKMWFIKFIHNGKFLLASADSQEMSNIWDTGTGALYAAVKESLWDAVILSDDVHIVLLSSDATLMLWDRRQDKLLCTDTTLNECEFVGLGVFPYSHHTRTLGFVSTHFKDSGTVVQCWAVEPVHTDGPLMVPIAHGAITSMFDIIRVDHTGSMENHDLRLVVEFQEGERFSSSWNDSMEVPQQPQELCFVQSLVEDVPNSPTIRQVLARESDDKVWILNEHSERVLWLPIINRCAHHGRDGFWYGRKLVTGGKSGRLTLVDFSNVNENEGSS
jgi:WD40 repeat protein